VASLQTRDLHIARVCRRRSLVKLCGLAWIKLYHLYISVDRHDADMGTALPTRSSLPPTVVVG